MLNLTVAGVSAFLLALLIGGVPAARAQEPEPIRYVVSFPAPQTHYLNVEATIPTGRQPQVELMMPVWTPGSYLVREYARNVEGFTARDAQGRSLPVEKTRKIAGASRVEVFRP